MAGIDFEQARLSQREAFSFSREEVVPALLRARAALSGAECVLISTCNRAELWAYGAPNTASLSAALSGLKGLEWTDYADLFVECDGLAAARRLFLTTSGLKSQIVGENQILGQVKDALVVSRTARSVGPVLTRLFEAAIAAAKRVKTETTVSRANRSTARAALTLARARLGGSLAGKRALVIGNGVIGRLCAQLLLAEGAGVTITLRHHHEKGGDYAIPQGASTLPYEERYAALKNFDVVFSATTSPHWTLAYDEVAAVWDGGPCLFIDLAMPRDMQASIATLSGATLLDMDALPSAEGESEVEREREHITRIIDEEVETFSRWLAFRPYNPVLSAITDAAGAGDGAAKKAVQRVLFALRDALPADEWSVFEALRTALAVEPAMRKDYVEAGDDGEVKRVGCAKRGNHAPPAQSDNTAPPKEWFPVFTATSGKTVVVVGGGAIAARRVKSLARFSWDVRVIAPVVCGDIEALAAEAGSRVSIERREYRQGDIAGAAFATAATNNREVNRCVGEECRMAGVPVSVADAAGESTFFFPALIVAGDIVVGVTSGGLDHKGASHAACKIRTALA
jgi:glutamyl-tRNA reductase